ncbi:stage II sporulation protein R [Clostridium sp. YIM B02551]|uniref:stage II sporulation protein R n=1 Tax=Clostridium sp. YIM B02551 TaxID=2910679 RepID=UPI001EEBF21F|nr:stage II sporulation protein R [Clostridium sp. YIM B02551]
MKKVISLLVIILLVINTFVYFNSQSASDKSRDNLVQEISTKLIRFHVIANSDSDNDQQLKIKVKDAIISYIFPKLKDSPSIDESRKILKSCNDDILKLASSIIKNNGYNYSVKSTMGRENFPDKSYGNITLPQGEYEAYRVIIGSGEGKNWWCVMFPPLCFVDETRGQVSEKETEKQMKRVLSDNEYDEVNNDVKIKFKIFELIQKWIKK